MAINPMGGMPMPGGTQGAQGSPSSELQRLEKQRDSLKQELSRLKQSREGGDAVKQKAEELRKQIEELEKRIQALKQQGGGEVQKQNDEKTCTRRRFDEYVKIGEDCNE